MDGAKVVEPEQAKIRSETVQTSRYHSCFKGGLGPFGKSAFATKSGSGSFDKQITAAVRAGFFQLRALAKFEPFLSFEGDFPAHPKSPSFHPGLIIAGVCEKPGSAFSSATHDNAPVSCFAFFALPHGVFSN